LIWEPVYNGYPTNGAGVPTDQWVHNDIRSGNFWMRNTAPGQTIESYGITLAQWADPSFVQPANSYAVNASTRIVSVEVGVGSGWSKTFNGAVDHVNVDFGTGAGGVSTNFEAGVPEPATWAMMLVGFGGLGAVLRRSRRKATLASA
jgi:hypothetical protein